MRNSSAIRQLLRMAALAQGIEPDGHEPLPINIDADADARELVDAFLSEAGYWGAHPLREPPPARRTTAGKIMLGLPAERQREALFEALDRTRERPPVAGAPESYDLVDCAAMLLGLQLGMSDEDLERVLQSAVRLTTGIGLGAPLFQHVLPHIERRAQTGALPPEIINLVQEELELYRHVVTRGEYSRLAGRVQELLSPQEAGLPEGDEPWVSGMLSGLRSLDEDSYRAWQRLLAHAMRTEQSKPTAKWQKEAAALIAVIGVEHCKSMVIGWFTALSAPVRRTLSPYNCQLFKGLAWACVPYEDADLARALGRLAEAMLTWLVLDWRGLRPGNAAVYALSVMDGDEPIVQLARLGTRLKGRQVQDTIGKAITVACQRRGMSREELEERTVPAVASADPAGAAESSKEARQQEAVQRARLERLLLSDRSWNLADWQVRYLNQPLLAPMVSRLIWRFEATDHSSTLGTAIEGAIVDVDGNQLVLDAVTTQVHSWHPQTSDAETVREWRRFLAGRRIVQPFKQAHRELYVATAAEQGDATERFAGHVIRQNQFKALCDQRGWRYGLQGRWVHGNGLATKSLDGWDLRAELLIEPAGEDEANGGNTPFYRFLTTGPVRFLGGDGEVVPVQRVPELAFSEVMRDVDLFVGVCSIGLTPAARKGPYAVYWREFAFAELTDGAAARHEALAEILPGLSFAGRCTLDGRYLVVRGDLRSYKIHVGSANVLMSPNDVFLNIPARWNPAAGAQAYLPFEGDTMLAQILSRAAVLAGDSHLTDPALKRQIERGAQRSDSGVTARLLES
jgi:hypothetical protein